jgi:hypothetical protein
MVDRVVPGAANEAINRARHRNGCRVRASRPEAVATIFVLPFWEMDACCELLPQEHLTSCCQSGQMVGVYRRGETAVPQTLTYEVVMAPNLGEETDL